jgi:phage terminase large subunit-like protein
VVSGAIVAGKPVRLACARHLRDLETGKARGLHFDVAAAERNIGFFRDVLVLDDGQPFEIVGKGPGGAWQAFVVGSLFGWKRGDVRRFRTAYVETGKGSGKTPLAAGVGIILTAADGEAAAEVYSGATAADQAKICWLDAKRMVERSPALSSRMDVSVAALSHPSSGSWFKPVSSEHRGLDGKRVHGALVDELHEHRDAQVVDKLRAGTKARKQALIFEITNSGYDRHSVCWQHHEYSLKVLEGILDNDEWFAYVCALDEGDVWTDPKVWIKANPSLGVTISEKYLAEQVREAEGMPSKQNIVRRLNFCEWTEQADRAIDMPLWDAGADPIDAAALRGRSCFGGLDLARVNDLSAFVLLFPPVDDGERWKVLPWFWAPEDDIRVRVQRDRVPYDVWERDGLLIATPGNTTDFAFIQAKILELALAYDIQQVAFDRTFAGEIVQGLMAEMGAERVVEFGQGFLSMAAPMAELLRLVKGEELQHGGHPVLRWNASNLACAEDPAGNLKPDKAHSTEKIDGISALCNAIGMALRSPGNEPFIGISVG